MPVALCEIFLNWVPIIKHSKCQPDVGKFGRRMILGRQVFSPPNQLWTHRNALAICIPIKKVNSEVNGSYDNFCSSIYLPNVDLKAWLRHLLWSNSRGLIIPVREHQLEVLSELFWPSEIPLPILVAQLRPLIKVPLNPMVGNLSNPWMRSIGNPISRPLWLIAIV